MVSTLSEPIHVGDVVIHVKYTKLFINGGFVDSVSRKTFEICDPRTGDVITRVSKATKEDVDFAVKAARNTFERESAPPMIERTFLYYNSDITICRTIFSV
eukprot:Gb_07809 [translate_table: standard]